MPAPLERIHSVVRMIALRNVVTLFGSLLTTISAVAIVFVVLMGTLEFVHTAYLGIISFLILPGFMIAGLVLVAFGHIAMRKREYEGEDAPHLVIDLRKPQTRRTVAFVVFLTAVNLFLISAVGFKGVEYSESVEFCGEVCHTVMEPEYTAYLDSPHSEVSCAECHIGPGADWFVKSKLSGVSQVFAVAFDTYHRPVKTPVTNLRPATDTCEQCHKPDKFHGDRVKMIHKYAEDEANTRLTTLLVMHIGGHHDDGGIHSWHVNEDRTTLYLPASEDRQEISLVRVRHADGKVENFAPEGFPRDPADVLDSEMRVMDCVDCHNRPTHIFYSSEEAIDRALNAGEIDNTLPYVRMVGNEALVAAETHPEPEKYIERHVRDYYAENYPDLMTTRKDTISTAIERLGGLYRRNVFPEMKIGWDPYPNNISHVKTPGCFRCHDDGHATPEGQVISQDCTSCHEVLAWDEENPQLAQDLGVL